MRYRWLPPLVISVTSSIGLSAGLSAAENTFRLEETTIAEIREAVAAGALSSEKLVELYLARIAASDYRFRQDWEQYLATFKSPKVLKTVAEFVKVYEAEVAPSALPVEDSVMSLLKTSLETSTDAPEYKDFIENMMPRATAEKLAVFENHGVDALVFPYVPTFAQPIKNPVYTIDDPAFVKSDAPVPATMSGYSSVGFPSIVVPMGFGSQGLPMTITFFGKPYDEMKIIGFAYAYEQASKMRKPSALVPPLKGETINYATK